MFLSEKDKRMLRGMKSYRGWFWFFVWKIQRILFYTVPPVIQDRDTGYPRIVTRDEYKILEKLGRRRRIMFIAGVLILIVFLITLIRLIVFVLSSSA